MKVVRLFFLIDFFSEHVSNVANNCNSNENASLKFITFRSTFESTEDLIGIQYFSFASQFPYPLKEFLSLFSGYKFITVLNIWLTIKNKTSVIFSNLLLVLFRGNIDLWFYFFTGFILSRGNIKG